MSPDDEAECRRVVLDFVTALNQWEVRWFTVRRLEAGEVAAPTGAVAGLTSEALLDEHRAIFARCVVPRERKYGSNLGRPGAWGARGSFFDVRPEGITAVVGRDRNTAEVTTDFGYPLPGDGRTLFVVRRRAGRWLIDSVRTGGPDGAWTNALL